MTNIYEEYIWIFWIKTFIMYILYKVLFVVFP